MSFDVCFELFDHLVKLGQFTHLGQDQFHLFDHAVESIGRLVHRAGGVGVLLQRELEQAE